MMFFCSPQLKSMVVPYLTSDVSPVACSGDDNIGVSWLPAGISGDSASDIVESQLSGQNDALNLSEGSVARSNRCVQPARIKNGSFDNGTLPVLSAALQTMKRSDSLPSNLLRYVSLVAYFMLEVCTLTSQSKIYFVILYLNVILLFVLIKVALYVKYVSCLVFCLLWGATSVVLVLC